MTTNDRDTLGRLIAPRSVALVGASPRPNSFAMRVIRNLRRYDGVTYLVNPKYDKIEGHPCYPNLSSLPLAPDMVIVSAPAEAVEALTREVVAVGAGGLVIYSSGFAETRDPDRITLQAKIARLATEGGVRLLGPNTVGFINYALSFNATFMDSLTLELPREHAIGLVSQSGALGLSLAQAINRGVSFSHALTCGNSADVDVSDFVRYLAEDPACKAIACTFEGLSDVAKFKDAAFSARRKGKPLVVCKLATGEKGAKAALSHTGSLAGSPELYAALFAEVGAIPVETIEALIPTAAFFAKAAAPHGRGISGISTSGGALILASDAAERHSVEMPPLSSRTEARLKARLPDFALADNPLDVTGQVASDITLAADCIEILLDDDSYAGLVVPITMQNESAATMLLGAAAAAARTHDKFVCAVFITQELQPTWIEKFESEPRVAVFHSMSHCFAAISAWLDPPKAFSESSPSVVGQPCRTRVRQTLLPSATRIISERDAKKVLLEYGIAVVDERQAQDAADVLRIANQSSFPLVMKIDSPDFPHKSDLGLVKLDIQSTASAKEAYEAIVKIAGEANPDARVDGVLMQPMVPSGIEMLIGGRIDDVFGPVVTVGFGGVLVELLNDTASASAPVSRDRARSMIEGLRNHRLLKGYRGLPAIDIEALSEAVERLSVLISDHADLLTEIDVNPVICGKDTIAVDALFVLRERATERCNAPSKQATRMDQIL